MLLERNGVAHSLMLWISLGIVSWEQVLRKEIVLIGLRILEAESENVRYMVMFVQVCAPSTASSVLFYALLLADTVLFKITKMCHRQLLSIFPCI